MHQRPRIKISECKPFVIVIVGPTASGKSELAVFIAKWLKRQKISTREAEIISADSRQVYRGMDIGTGKVPKDRISNSCSRITERKGAYYYKKIRHHLIDVASPRRTFTVARYQKLARKALEDIVRRKHIPIVCGGTGFYVQAVIDGLIIPQVKPNIALRYRFQNTATDELYALLQKEDPDRAKVIDSRNRRRLIRALEIIHFLGKVPPLRTSPLPYPVVFIGVQLPLDVLKQRIYRRLRFWFRKGFIREVNKLHVHGLSWQRLENFGLEYRSVALFLQKKFNYSEMLHASQKELYQYAKRQITWLKKDKRIYWVSNSLEAIKIIQSAFF